ncbi:MAG: hypothetical protein MRZ33_01870 [Prevotella sp.]|nr:hypothetical protein [Prevotella sp.]
MKNLTWQNPEQLFVAQELINKVKSKCCGIKVYNDYNGDLALDADFPIVHFNDTTLNGICSFYPFDPCHLLLYNGHTVEPSKIYGGYLK